MKTHHHHHGAHDTLDASPASCQCEDTWDKTTANAADNNNTASAAGCGDSCCDNTVNSGGDDACCGHETSGQWKTRSLVVAGLCVAGALALEWSGTGTATTVAATGAAGIVAGGWFLIPSVWAALRSLRATVPLLMVLATLGAAATGQWSEAATVVFLFGIAEWLEGWADRRSRNAVKALLETAPETAFVRSYPDAAETDAGAPAGTEPAAPESAVPVPGAIGEVPVAAVPVGAVVLVRGGERIPLDGVVSAGHSAVNQAPVTGESIPVEKETGDIVFAGTINGEGLLEVRVTKRSGDTVLAGIIRLVSEARARRAPVQRFVDEFARYYTPSVAALALLVFLVPVLAGASPGVWLYRACVLLLIACPCALVIATPVSIVAGMASLTRRGVLVKGGANLETLGKLRVLAFDKTGTLTEGKPRVLGVVPASGTGTADVLRVAAAIDEDSTHPLAQAIVAHAQGEGLTWARAEAVRVLAGRGVEARVAGVPVFAGNQRLARELGVGSPELDAQLEAIETRGQSAVIIGERPAGAHSGGGRVLGVLALGDALRPGAAAAVAALRVAGVRHLVMLSGDNPRTAEVIARQAGVDEAFGGLLPEDKVAGIVRLRERFGVVGMVGDGINDAPALAEADVGIAMGAAGSDAAIETADVALMNEDLHGIADAVRTGRRTLAVIRFNIGFALGVKVLVLGLALPGLAGLWMAILADTGTTLLVVANSLRLLKANRISPPPSYSAGRKLVERGD